MIDHSKFPGKGCIIANPSNLSSPVYLVLELVGDLRVCDGFKDQEKYHVCNARVLVAGGLDPRSGKKRACTVRIAGLLDRAWYDANGWTVVG